MACKKCASPASITLRKKDTYCTECFETTTNHKFRACIGKNKILSKNENVLICLSGGIGSTVLLDLVSNGLSMDSHRKLRINPIFLHLLGVENGSEGQAENIVIQCSKYNFDVYIVHITHYMEADFQVTAPNTIPPPPEDNSVSQFQAMLNSIPASTNNDLILKIRRKLFVMCAKQLNCNFIFTGETTTTLATTLLSNLALGRGSQVESDIGFCDSRNDDIRILRPMKDISQEELDCYIKIKHLEFSKNNEIKANSLQSVIGAFVQDLQENFPATISTVCKTADKLGVLEDCKKGDKCVICKSHLNVENFSLTAYKATQFSRTVSDKQSQSIEAYAAGRNDDNLSTTMFPYFPKYFCYSCSKNYAEMDNCNLPNYLKELLINI